MTRILLMAGASAGSWIGWVAGEKVGLMTAVFASGVGGVVGAIGTWKLLKRFED